MININKIQATWEPMHVSKLFLTRRTSGNNKVNQSWEIYFLETNVKVYQLFEIDYLLPYIFLHLSPRSPSIAMFTFQASDLRS